MTHQASDLRRSDDDEQWRTRGRKLGVKGSQVQILSARPAHFEAPFGVPRFVYLRECVRFAPESGYKRVSLGVLLGVNGLCSLATVSPSVRRQ